MKIVLATRNQGKYNELAKMLQTDDVKFIPITDFDADDIEETGKTYKENAVLKSRYASKTIGLPAIADDSGMEIRALGGYPGVKSARCAGENANDFDRIEHVLEKMRDVKDRYVEFVCTLVLSFPRGRGLTAHFEGRCSGVLANEVKGEVKPGIQYDAIFTLPEYENRTFGELSQEIKNDISHRADACRKMRSYLNMLKGFKK